MGVTLQDIIGTEHITSMQALFAKDVWVQNETYANYCGDGADPEEATRCCIMGGWCLLHPYAATWASLALQKFVQSSVGVQFIEQWQDREERTVDDIRALVSSPSFQAFEAAVYADWITA